MACVKSDGTLTDAAKALLAALDEPMNENRVAEKWDKPLFRVRSMLREMSSAGLVDETDGRFRMTPAGKAKLD
ncbi:MAG: hypothetical protein ACLFOY_05280 [Desulfatibacillaceae bacterium]